MRRVKLGAVAGLSVLLLVAVVYFAELSEVHFLSGLDVPVQVSVEGEAPFTLEPGQRSTRWLRGGVHRVRTTSRSGELLEELDLGVARGVVGYNVLGTAPLYTYTATYVPTGSPQPDDGLPTPLCGRSVFWLPRVDYAFTEAPRTIQVKGSTGAVHRVVLDVAEGGVVSTLSLLQEGRDWAGLARLRQGLSRLPEMEPLVSWLGLMLEGQEVTATLALRDFEDSPRDVDRALVALSLAGPLGRVEAVRQRIREVVAQHPDDPALAYLAARSTPTRDSIPLLEAVVAAQPRNWEARGTLAARLTRLERPAEALRAFEPLEEVLRESPELLETWAVAMVQAGRTEEAAKKVAEVVRGRSGGLRDLVLHGRLRALLEKPTLPSARDLLRQIHPTAQAGMLALLDVELGQKVAAEQLAEVHPESQQAVARTWKALPEGPASTWSAAGKLSSRAQRALGDELTLLLAAEFTRVGDEALAERVLDSHGFSALERARLRAAVEGRLTPEELERLDLGERAAVKLVHARWLDAQGLPSAREYAEVERLDVLRGPVTTVLRAWSRPEPRTALAQGVVEFRWER